MSLQPNNELPIRSKLKMVDEIRQILSYLNEGDRSAFLPLLEDLKARSLFLDEQIQHDVLAFASQVLFQYDYDPWHTVTPDIQKAADKLIEDMGFVG